MTVLSISHMGHLSKSLMSVSFIKESAFALSQVKTLLIIFLVMMMGMVLCVERWCRQFKISLESVIRIIRNAGIRFGMIRSVAHLRLHGLRIIGFGISIFIMQKSRI